MGQCEAVRSVGEAARIIKEMYYEGEEWGTLEEAARGALRKVIEDRMEVFLRRGLEEVARQGIVDRRNGHYPRHLLTALGDIELSVPRTRTFSAIEAVQRYARRHRHLDRAILGCFILGLSTRKVGEALLPIFGERVSPATVSRVAKTLDQAVVEFHGRRLSNRYKVLILDGVVLSRKTGAGAIRQPVLVALGITHDRKKEIIDFRRAASESEAEWVAFLTDLQDRGLTGERLEMIAVDGGPGLAAALKVAFHGIPVQRCWAHKSRNLLDRFRAADRERAKHHLARIRDAKNLVEARAAARRFADRWGETYPKAVVSLWKDLDELLTVYRFKDPGWRRLCRTTNAIERRFREVRRRTRPMGVFSDRTSLERVLYGVFSYLNKAEGTWTPFPMTHNS